MADTNPSGPPKKPPFFLLHPAKWFAYRKSIPIEQRSYTKVYGILSILLFAFTVWAVLDEVMARRPWKDIQADFKQFKVERLNIEKKKERAKIPADVRKAIAKELSAAQKAMNTDRYLATLDEIEDVDKDIADAQRDYTFAKSESDEIYYHLEEARTHREETKGLEEDLKEVEDEMRVHEAEVKKLTAKRDALVTKIKPAQDRLKKAEGVRDSVYANVIAIDRKIEAVNKMPVQVKQTVLLNYEKTNFNNLKMRVDRCETCHLSYADPLFRNDTLVSTDAGEIKKWLKNNKYNDADHYEIKKLGAKKDTVVAVISALYRMHPNVDLMIRKHRVGEPAAPGVLGCTSCHGGQGPSIVSTEFAHGMEKHWPDPLLTGHYVQASCQTCHTGKMDFEGAEWISYGKKLFTGFGCYGCHQMPGYEELTQQGPSLLNVGKKLTPEWIFQWIKNPRGWEHGTRMPNFLLTDKQAENVTAYLLDASKDVSYQPVANYGGGGNPLAGKQLFFDVGCVGCHAVDEWQGNKDLRLKEGPTFGPGLDKIGSKVTASWLYDWIKNPKNYNQHARMPSLRLTDGEAADLTAYLMQHTGTNDSVKKTPSGNLSDGAAIADGAKIIRDMGCFGCHEIKGMEKQPKVAVSLATFGNKTTNDLFFGNQPNEVFEKYRSNYKKIGLPLGQIEEHAAHGSQDWYTWVIGKMKHSRMYATERIPQMMPNFDMSNQEAYAISVFLRSQTGKFVGGGYVNPEPQQAMRDKGRMFVHWNNCVGCHKVENGGGYIGKLVNEKFAGDQNIAYYAPPYLGPEGSRVQEDWLHSFLRGPFKIRPLVKFRMPTYGFSDEQLQTASNYFLATHNRQYVMTNYTYRPDPSLLPAGKYLFDKLKCLSCHYLGAPNADTKAPSLAMIKRRIRPDWLPHWLLRPDSIMPGTPMTAFWWASGKPAPADSVLGGDYKLQIRAVIDYVWSINTDEMPSSSPYATINGVDRYVFPDGSYSVMASNMATGGVSAGANQASAAKPMGKKVAMR